MVIPKLCAVFSVILWYYSDMYKKTPSRITIRNRRRLVVRAILWSGFAWCVFSIVRLFWIGEARLFEDGDMVFSGFSTDLKSFVTFSISIFILYLLVLSFVSPLKVRMVTVEHTRTKFYESWSKHSPYYFVAPSHTVDVRVFGKHWLRTFSCPSELHSTMKAGKTYVVCTNGTTIEDARLANNADEWRLEQGLPLDMNQ